MAPNDEVFSDEDSDSDDEEEEAGSIHHFKKIGMSMRQSLAAGALHIHVATEQDGHIISSIGGRLGGQLADPAVLQAIQQQDDAAAGEKTPLVTAAPTKETLSAPPLSIWIFPALLCAAAYAFYNIFIKKGSADIHPILGGVVLQFVAALLGSVLLAALLLSGDAKPENIHYDSHGLYWSACAGLAVGTAEMLSFFVSSLGVQASQFIPIIIGGAVMFGAVLGLLMLKETMMLHGWCGILLLVTGIAMVATDKGDKVEEGSGSDPEDDETVAPSLAIWIAPALVCAAAYAFYNIFIKKSSSSINPILGGVVLQFVAAIFGSILLGAIILEHGGETDFLNMNATGLFWACCAGVAVGSAEMLSFCVSGMGVDATKSIPIIIGGSIMMGSVLGLIMLGETLLLQGWVGVAVLMSGIALVATDPGEKVQGH